MKPKAPHRKMPALDFDESPFITFWEITQACDLACVHCRAQAQSMAHPDQLTPEEGQMLIDQIAELGTRMLILSGGDPLKRADFFDLIEYATQKGIHTSISPSGTPLVTFENMKRAREAGAKGASLSLDGPNADYQDRFRATPGSFQWTMEGIRNAQEAGLRVQINTTVTADNVDLLDDMAELMHEIRPMIWSLFLLVPTGRGKDINAKMISADEMERVFNWLYDLSQEAPFAVKTTAAQHYRRVMLQRETERRAAEGKEVNPLKARGIYRTAARGPHGHGGGGHPGGMARGVNDGNGTLFISHTGEIFPSGFLPISAGNVRDKSVVEVYRESQLFQDLRDPEKLKGKCGHCEYKVVCGGSRARAYGVTGDYLESEPYCSYEPAQPQASDNN